MYDICIHTQTHIFDVHVQDDISC